jgi:hypothetical protein
MPGEELPEPVLSGPARRPAQQRRQRRDVAADLRGAQVGVVLPGPQQRGRDQQDGEPEQGRPPEQVSQDRMGGFP